MPRFPDDPEQVRMTFSEHLEELRSRLLKSFALVVICFLGTFAGVMDPIQRMITWPHRSAVQRLDPALVEQTGIQEALTVMSPIEAIFFKLKISFVIALVVGFPFVLYQIWAFVAVGLYPHERRIVMRIVPFALGLGVLGILFGYFVAVPVVLQFLYAEIDPAFFDAQIRLKEYLSVFLTFTFSLALVFQLPLILATLGAAGVLRASSLRRYRRHAIVGVFLLSAIFTPPDPYSQVTMALPTVLLYELGILLVAGIERRRASPDSAS